MLRSAPDTGACASIRQDLGQGAQDAQKQLGQERDARRKAEERAAELEHTGARLAQDLLKLQVPVCCGVRFAHL